MHDLRVLKVNSLQTVQNSLWTTAATFSVAHISNACT